MKKLLLLLLLPVLSMAQLRLNEKESFGISVINAPIASVKEKGIFVGAEIEYIGKVYTRIGISNFQKLEDGYTEMIGGIGLNFTSGYFSKVRYYAGGRLGAVKREKANAIAGLEAGIDFDLSEGSFIGVRASIDNYSDKDFYKYPDYMKNKIYVRFGLKF